MARTHTRVAASISITIVATALVVSAAPAGVSFVALSPEQSGVDVFVNDTARELWGNGAAFFDFDNDGDLDLMVGNGSGAGDWLFRQNADHTFADVAASAGVADPGATRGIKFADLDNDGDEDVFVANNNAPSRLYRNNGDGTFTGMADAMLASGTYAMSGAWGDYDRDGFVDLYVVRRREANQLFHNNGDGTFTDRAPVLGLDDALAGLEAVWFDYDNDGDADLYLSNDKFGGNRLWSNDGRGAFVDVSVASRSNVAINSMGVALGDYDGNGFVDIYLTNTPERFGIKNVLLRNNGNGTFDNVATPLKVFAARYGWGCDFLDCDNDGDLDLYVVNWDVEPGAEAARNLLYQNNGDGTFSDVSDEAGVADAGPGFALALADYDDDGLVDMFVGNNGAPSVFYHNVSTGGRWLKVRTVGTLSNRDGIGARVTITAGGVTQIRDVSGGQSYLCQPSLEVEFGLGGVVVVDEVAVSWPSGIVDRYIDVHSNGTLIATEGEMHDPIPPPGGDEPDVFDLSANYPNPFNPRTTIAYTLPASSRVTLSVFDARGRLVRVLVDGERAAGRHEAVWTGRDAEGIASASGVYFYRLETELGVRTRRMVLLK